MGVDNQQNIPTFGVGNPLGYHPGTRGRGSATMPPAHPQTTVWPITARFGLSSLSLGRAFLIPWLMKARKENNYAQSPNT